MECGAPRRLLASTYTSQAYFRVRDSLFGDANDSKELSAVQRRPNNHRQILLKDTFHVYELHKGGAERRTPRHSRTRAISVCHWLLEAYNLNMRSRRILYTLSRAQEVFLPSLRATPGAIHLAGLSGRRTMYELIWDDGYFVTTTHFFTLSPQRLHRALATISFALNNLRLYLATSAFRETHKDVVANKNRWHTVDICAIRLAKLG